MSATPRSDPAGKLREILVQDLYRRALAPILFLIPILYVLYRVLERAIEQRPVIAWIFLGMIAVLLPRIAAVLLVERIKARFPDPRVRIGVFAVPAALLGLGMAAVNVLAAPVVGPEELAIMVIVAAGINSIAIISLSPSLLTYFVYMVPNIASMAVAVAIGPPLAYGGVLLFLICMNLLSFVFMATSVHLATRKAVQLRLDIDAANEALRDSNARLQSEIAERHAAENALRHRNVELEVLNRRLAEAQAQLVQSEKLASVGQLAAGIAHEINNPLAFVHSNLNCLKTYASDMLGLLDAYDAMERGAEDRATAARRIESLKRAANMDVLREDLPSLISESSDGLSRVERIVKDLREFTNIDHADRQWVDLKDCIEHTLSVAAHQIAPRADIVRDYAALPPIECRPAEINQALLNITLNAVQSMDRRGTITVRTWRDGDYAAVSIADTGRGIAPANLDRIFDPFFTTREVGSGMGLGLTNAYRIVQQHGGRIDVDSVVGKGTTVTLRLPVKA